MANDTSGGSSNPTDAAASANYDPDNSYYCSMEQIYSPVIIKKNAGADGGFEQPVADADSSGAFKENHIGPTRSELDPYFSNIFEDPDSWMSNLDFQMMVNDGTDSDGGKDLNIRKLQDRTSINTVQVTHFRGPFILSGWGYGLDDRPCSPSGAGSFTFDSDIVSDRKKWKSGPVDLRWDKERKVWATGPQIVCGVADGDITAPTSPCTGTKFTVKVFRSDDTSLRTDHLAETIEVTNRDPSLSQTNYEGTVFVMAIRVNYEWLPLWVGCPTEIGDDQC